MLSIFHFATQPCQPLHTEFHKQSQISLEIYFTSESSSHGSLHFGRSSEPFIGDSHSRSGGWWFCWFWKTRGAKELSFGLRNTRLRPNAAWSLLHSLLPPPSKQSISVVLQGKHIYWLVMACQCGSSGPVAEGISLGRGQGENRGN